MMKVVVTLVMIMFQHVMMRAMIPCSSEAVDIAKGGKCPLKRKEALA